MIFNPDLLDLLESCESNKLSTVVYRHMFADFSPDRENFRGARWNPPETSAIYTALSRDTCLAEAEYYIGLQPLRPSALRKLYTIEVELPSVIELVDWKVLEEAGVEQARFSQRDYQECQMVGGAAAWLGISGIIVPSARHEGGSNLVIYPANGDRDYRFEEIDREEIPD